MIIDCIIVTYNPELDLLNAELQSLREDIHDIYIVNNSDYPLEGVLPIENLHIINLLSNTGIAHAQNVAIKKIIKSNESDFILFFDQDSILPVDYVKDMITAISEHGNLNVALYGPTIFNRANNENYKRSHNTSLSKDGAYLYVSENISSGSLVPVSMLKSVGLMEEGLFLDFVDFEWCWRAIAKGYKIVQFNNVTLSHQVGEKSIKILGINLIKCSPFRCKILWQSYGRLIGRDYVPRYWKMSMGIKLILQSILFPICFAPHYSYFKCTVTGFTNAILGRS